MVIDPREAALLQVDLRINHPGVILDNVRHHAPKLEPLALELFAWMTMILGADSKYWLFKQARTGANSFSLSDGYRNFHLRGDREGNIRVYTKARQGRLLETLTTRGQVRRFIQSLTEGGQIAA
jgi:hypothetical protein